ncbi:MAG: hypothetical protein LBL92_06790, partial [Propionibacteriaceae bacterium]|nr:hypothetical protein [Propionibacteriaceae bacterium]
MTVATPWPPGAIDQVVEPRLMMAYLEQLGQWLTQRRSQLDQLDQAILALPQAGSATSDLMLALSVWQAIQRRYEDLLRVWDSGRVGLVQQQQLSQLLWSRLDDTTAAPGTATASAQSLSTNLAEACRLSDALTAQLASTIHLTPASQQFSHRLAGLRAQIERLRDQVELEPPASRSDLTATIEDIATDTAELTAKAGRGG